MFLLDKWHNLCHPSHSLCEAHQHLPSGISRGLAVTPADVHRHHSISFVIFTIHGPDILTEFVIRNPFKVQKGKVPISTGIMNPHVFYTDPHSNPNANQNWTSETRVDLWGCRTSSNTGIDASVSKTIYDPSPSGFCLPASGAFSATTINGNDQSTDRNINGDRFITLFANNQANLHLYPYKKKEEYLLLKGKTYFSYRNY